jgi:hypothetical protein
VLGRAVIRLAWAKRDDVLAIDQVAEQHFQLDWRELALALRNNVAQRPSHEEIFSALNIKVKFSLTENKSAGNVEYKSFYDDNLYMGSAELNKVFSNKLVLCPECDSEMFTDTDEEELTCEGCGAHIALDRDFSEEIVWHPKRKF